MYCKAGKLQSSLRVEVYCSLVRNWRLSCAVDCMLLWSGKGLWTLRLLKVQVPQNSKVEHSAVWQSIWLVEKSRLQRDWLDICSSHFVFSSVEKTDWLSFIWSSAGCCWCWFSKHDSGSGSIAGYRENCAAGLGQTYTACRSSALFSHSRTTKQLLLCLSFSGVVFYSQLWQ